MSQLKIQNCFYCVWCFVAVILEDQELNRYLRCIKEPCQITYRNIF